MIDILYLTHGRLEFTKASVYSMIENTDWRLVDRLVWYDDDSVDGTKEFFHQVSKEIPVHSIDFRPGRYGSPVVIMNDYIRSSSASVFCKLDNDVVLPKFWLNESMKVMVANPQVDLLGIEAFDEAVPGEIFYRSWRPTGHIGGIGLMRRRAFNYGLPQPEGQRHGFTAWQEEMGIVTKGWIVPALPVLLLDLMPTEPWASLSRKYVRSGFQREWPPYDSKHTLWPWIQKGVPTHAGQCAV